MRLVDAEAKGLLMELSTYSRYTGIDEAPIETAVDAIHQAPTIDVPQWIPCEERLPEEYGLYLATMNDGFVQECSFVPTDYGDVLLNGWSTCEASGFKVLNEADVLAWMPLPKPYAERKDDD